MRTIILSDLHIGDPRYEDNDLTCRVLEKEPFDRLILNGDVVDMWTASIKTLRKNPILEYLSKIAKDKEVIWVLGNHDWLAQGKNLIPGATEVESYVIPNTSILCVHGHQVYEFQNMAWYAVISTTITLWFWRTIGWHLQRFFTTGKLYEWAVSKRRQAILRRFGEHVATIVMGHTHLVGYCSNNGSEVYDIGSLPIIKTYAVVQDGMVWFQKASNIKPL